jgi:redox-sensitive bicupin YhaK (pirin superfamily)
MKRLIHKQQNNHSHWVGDGFPVRSIFSYNDLGKHISPFLLLDYGGPTHFPPTDQIKGVGTHPHRGFETVTIVYSGEVEHKDSTGGGGVISDGDVQWMTAARGLVHEEYHGRNYAKTGGPFEMVQLWVNLPKKDKMTTPRYQGIKKDQIPEIDLPNKSGKIRIIAGEYLSHNGPALTFTPINLWDITLTSGSISEFTVPEGHTTSVFVLSGKVKLNDGSELGEAEIGLLENTGTQFSLKALEESKILFLGGEPINEPIVGYGPFVMNTEEEIHQAFKDFQSGRFG